MKLKHACTDPGQYGINVSPDQYRVNGVRMIRTSDLGHGRLSPPEEGVFLDGPVPAAQLLQPNDLLLSRAGTIGRSYLAPTESSGMTFAGFLIRFRPARGTDPRFLHYAIQSEPVQEQIISGAVISTIQNFNADRYANLELPEICVDQQRRIADFLDDRISRIDRIIAARRQQAVLARSAPWTKFGSAVEQAPKVSFRRAIKFIADGPFGSAFTSADYVNSGPAAIRLGNIGFAEFRDDELARVPSDIYANFPLTHVSAGNLLIASLGDANNHAGRACVAPPTLGPAMVKGKCFRAIAERSVADEEFLAILLSSPTGSEGLTQHGTGATRNMLNFERLKSCRLPMPPRAAQDQIAAEFRFNQNDATRAVTALQESIDLLTEYKSSLITAAVTGEFDVTTAGSNIPE